MDRPPVRPATIPRLGLCGACGSLPACVCGRLPFIGHPTCPPEPGAVSSLTTALALVRRNFQSTRRPALIPFQIDPAGWASGATRVVSPNFDARPPGMEVELLVVHNISLPPGLFGGPAIAAFFTNTLDHDSHPFFAQIRGVRVSAHFLIRRDGAVVQFVSCEARAWHAGLSEFFGRERCNDFSVGVELEGADDVPFDAAQYRALAQLTDALMARYPIKAIVGHADVAPHRKTDPGPCFDWRTLQKACGLPGRYFPYQADMPDAVPASGADSGASRQP